MKRSLGVTAIAVLSLVGSIFVLLIAIGTCVVLAIAPIPQTADFPGSPVTFKVIVALAALVYVLPAIWGIVTSVGLFCLANWARISTIVFAVLLVLMSGFALLTIFLMPAPPQNPQMNPSVMRGIRIGMGIFWSVLVSFGVWWLVFFNRSKVKSQFALASASLHVAPSEIPVTHDLQLPAAAATQHARHVRPMSITVIAWLLLIGSLFAPLTIGLHVPAIVLTRILMGGSAAVFYVILGILNLYIGIGLLRLKPFARRLGAGYFAFTFVSSAVFYFAPGGHDRMRALMDAQQQIFSWTRSWQRMPEAQGDMTPLLYAGAVAGLILIALQLYFLVTRKAAFTRRTIRP